MPIPMPSTRPLRGREGFALPLALLGLVLTSVLVTSALLTSSTEVALSRAHQDAMRSLYATQGALEAYVRVTGNGLTAIEEEYTSPGGDRVNIGVVELFRFQDPDLPQPERLYSVTAEPLGGGRQFATMVHVGPYQLGIESAATFGGNSEIGGSTIVSDGSDAGNVSCTGQVAPQAILHADGTTVDTTGNKAAIIGDATESELDNRELIRATLGGYSIREFLRFVHDRQLGDTLYTTFGTNEIWGESPAFNGTGNTKPNSLGTDGSPKSKSDPYNWYCPGKMETEDNCWSVSGIDTISYRVVAIDADSGVVKIQGDHGQGMLIVVNGGIQVTGGFIFRGIVLAEGDIDLSGTGNKVEGAIVSQNEVRVDRPNDSDSDVLGNAVVRYNQCAIDNVIRTINPEAAPSVVSRTFAMTELVH